MSWVRVWIHIVFSTKNRFPYLKSQDLRKLVFTHIKENAKAKGIYLANVGGYTDHVHCLISLDRETSLSKTVQLIKGESSFWINKSKIIPVHFSWQDDYWAVSVSESHLQQVKNYIEHQEQHHKTLSFSEEINNFLNKYKDPEGEE